MVALSFNEVWVRICEATGWSRYGELASFLNIQPPSISGAKRRGVFPVEWAIDVAKGRNLGIDYILFGDGPRSAEDSGNSLTTEPTTTWAAPDECSQIPQYNAEPAAGHGAVFEGEQVVCHMPFSNKWLKYMGLDPACLVVVAARGDSMQPTIKDGALLMLDTRKTVPTDGIYVLRLDGGLIVKRLQINPLDKSITIKSDNGSYDPITAQGDQLGLLDFVGRVVWIGNKA